ncbi:MAG TPA: PIN domain-containing protein [Verrucomicrobiota bacterium]|nr:PIN domain-containing protein [Verrucomicrobiota bacterium]
MTADFPILLDACVLANFGVGDLFLRLAEPPRLIVPRWSEAILDEVRRAQLEKLKPAWPVAVADSWRQAVTRFFPDAAVTGYEELFPSLTNDEGDRHVLAAAIKSGVTVIVTFNLRHFPAAVLQPWKIEAVHPQDYLLTLYSMNPAVVMAKLSAISRDRKTELEDVIIHLGRSLPRFAGQILNDMGQPGGPLGRLPNPPQ